MATLYLNSYCSIIDNGKNITLFTTIEKQIFLPKDTVKKLLDTLPCDVLDLEIFLDKTNIELLIEASILKVQSTNTAEMDSVNRGWFASRNEEDIYDEIKQKTVLILGCGGLGTHSAWAMTALGVKKIILIDDDLVSKDNLNRQILYNQDDIGKFKVDVLSNKLSKINKEIEIAVYKIKVLNPHQDLSNIIKENYPIDIAIKAVDSPDNHVKLFSQYFSDMSIPYTSGGTVGDGFVLGPTYHPSLENNYKKEIDTQLSLQRISVKGISLPMIMEKVASEVNIEALNILSNRLDQVKFNDSIQYNTIHSKQNITGKDIISGLLLFILGLSSSYISLLIMLLLVLNQKLSSKIEVYISLLISSFIFKKTFLYLINKEITIDLITLFSILFILSVPIAMYCLFYLIRSNVRRKCS